MCVPFAEDPPVMPIRYGDEEVWTAVGTRPPARCHDCGVAIGGYHDAHCDMEEDPVIGGQALTIMRPRVVPPVRLSISRQKPNFIY
jgi:hypothetical protein